MLLFQHRNPTLEQVTGNKTFIFYHERPNLKQYEEEVLHLEKEICTNH